MEIPLRLFDHTGLWLTAIAGFGILRNHAILMMGTIIESRDVDASRCKLILHPCMQHPDIFLGKFALCHAGLVGNDDKQIPFLLRYTTDIKDFSMKLDVLGFMRISGILIDDAVTIDEQCLLFPVGHASTRNSTKPICRWIIALHNDMINGHDRNKIRYVWGPMNWQLSTIAVLVILMLFTGLCRDDHDRPKDSGARGAAGAETNDYDPFTDTISLKALLDSITALQNAAATGKTKSVQRLIAAAHDTIAACIFVVGTAVTVRDSTGEINPGRTRLQLKNSAYQWALFDKSWICGHAVKFGSGIPGKVLYCRELLERQRNDTIEALYMAPCGSIVE